MNPKISVIVPVYKAEKYLHRCVDSILAQTFTDFEVLLIDDGSPDRSGEICDEYAQKDSRVRVFHKENGGVSSARNRGLDEATGEYIIFIDSDDKLEQNTFQICSLYYEKYDLIRFSVCFELDCFGNKTDIKHIHDYPSINQYVEDLVTRDIPLIGVCGGIFHKDIIDSQGLRFNVDLRNGEDWLFLVEYSLLCHSIKIIKTPLYYYNLFNDTSCTNTVDWDKFFEEVFAYKQIEAKLVKNEMYSHALNEARVFITIDALSVLVKLNLSISKIIEARQKLYSVIAIPEIKSIVKSRISILKKLLVLLSRYTLLYLISLFFLSKIYATTHK